MTADSHRSRQAAASSEAREALVELLVGHVDRAYITAGQPGALSAVRELFRRMNDADLTDLVYALDLQAEPVREAEAEGRSGEPLGH
jgi:hypothetical protein